jgi:hypothetical protein
MGLRQRVKMGASGNTGDNAAPIESREEFTPLQVASGRQGTGRSRILSVHTFIFMLNGQMRG